MMTSSMCSMPWLLEEGRAEHELDVAEAGARIEHGIAAQERRRIDEEVVRERRRRDHGRQRLVGIGGKAGKVVADDIRGRRLREIDEPPRLARAR